MARDTLPYWFVRCLALPTNVAHIPIDLAFFPSMLIPCFHTPKPLVVSYYISSFFANSSNLACVRSVQLLRSSTAASGRRSRIIFCAYRFCSGDSGVLYRI